MLHAKWIVVEVVVGVGVVVDVVVGGLGVLVTEVMGVGEWPECLMEFFLVEVEVMEELVVGVEVMVGDVEAEAVVAEDAGVNMYFLGFL